MMKIRLVLPKERVFGLKYEDNDDHDATAPHSQDYNPGNQWITFGRSPVLMVNAGSLLTRLVEPTWTQNVSSVLIKINLWYLRNFDTESTKWKVCLKCPSEQ